MHVNEKREGPVSVSVYSYFLLLLDRNTHFQLSSADREKSRFAEVQPASRGNQPAYASRLAECIAQLLLLFSQQDIYGSFTSLRA